MTDLGTVFVLVLGGVSVVMYSALMLGFVLGRRRSLRAARGAPPPEGAAALPFVSILRPLAGSDDDLADNLSSLARLDYPRYEVLLGVASLEDGAVPAARAFLRDHPEVRARLIVTNPDAAWNPKVAQLLGLEVAARGDLVWISDSNVLVPPTVLSGLVAELARPGVGMASNIVVGTGERSVGAALENLQICSQIAPSVLSMWFWAGRAITVGKSMAMRRDALHAVGGLAVVANILAEDDTLGRIFRAAGWQVRVCAEAVENRNRQCGLQRTLERHSRWARMRRAVCPQGFVFEPLLSPLVISLAGLALAPGRATAVMLGVALALQTLGAYTATALLRGKLPPPSFVPLEIARALVLFGCWVYGLGGRRISWRGHSFLLGPGSALEPVPARPAAARLGLLRGIWPRASRVG
jgi:ceramide glucosyltransferase